MGQFEKEDSHPRMETLQKIADALGVPVYEFSLNEGERIKAIREMKGLSRESLGKKVGLTSKQISEIEALVYRPSNYMIIKLAEALDIPYTSLVPGEILSEKPDFDDKETTNHSDDSIKAIIRKLFICDVPELSSDTDKKKIPGIYFIEDNHPYVITDQALYDLVPLVDGLVVAYVNQKKVDYQSK